MKISTRGRYALRVMTDLAMHNSGEYIPLKDISERQSISIKYLEQIISVLNKSGFLKSSRGSAGGYMLAKPAYDYTVGDILRATEGSLAPVVCINDDPNTCPRSNTCETLWVWQGLYKSINDYVDSITLSDIVCRQSNINGNDYSI